MKKATKKWMAVLMLLVMLFDAAPLPVLAEELPQGSDLLTANYSEPKQLDFTLPEYTLTEDEFTVSPVKDMQSLISAVNKPVPMKRGLLKAAARNTAEQNQQADAATASITGYAAFDIKLTEGAHKAESYSVPVSFDAPIDVFADNPDRNALIVRVSCTLYHFLEDGSYTVVKDAQVNWADNLLTGFTFTADGFSAFLLKYTVDFTYIEKTGNISLNFENAKETGNEFGQLIQKNAHGLEEIAVTDILDFIAQDADHQQFSGEVYTLSLSDAIALADFNADFFSAAGVDIEGKGVEYGSGTITLIDSFDSAKITFAANHTTLELTLSNYTKPEKPVVPDKEEGFAYRFYAVGESVTVENILTANEIVSSYYSIESVSDNKLVAVETENNTLTAQDYFDEVILTVSLSDGTEVEITLSNPAPVKAGETVTTEGVGFFVATEEIPAGTELVVDSNPKIPDGIVIPGGGKKRGGPVESDPVFFDISLVGPDGKEIQTGANVTITTDIALPEAPEGQTAKITVHVYHINEKGEADPLTVLDYRCDADSITSVNFMTDGFSLFAITYTVDFISTEGMSWSWPGQSAYNLSSIMEILGVTAPVTDAELVLVSGTPKENELYLTQENGEYVLHSDVAFRSVYELRVMADKLYLITVKDSASTTDLSELLDHIDIQNNNNETVIENGSQIIIDIEKTYEFIFSFKEKPELQYDLPGPLYYDIPDGVDLNLVGPVEFETHIGSRVIPGNTYSVVEVPNGNGGTKKQIQVQYNMNHMNSAFLEASQDVELDLHFTGRITREFVNNSLNFSAGTSGYSVINRHETNASVSKEGYYDATSKKMIYTVSVTATQGSPENVNVVDTITGTALTFGAINYVKDTSNGETVTYQNNNAQNGLNITITRIEQGHTIKIEYTADVDFTKIAVNNNATVQETGNGVVISSPSDNQPDDNVSYHDEKNINFSSVTKIPTSVGDIVDENGNTPADGYTGRTFRIVTWKVTANTEGNVSLKDSDITDRLLNNADAEYYGTGLTVKKQLVTDTNAINWDNITGDSVPWADVGVTDLANADGWTYRATDDGNYAYEITYQTRVELTGMAAGTSKEVVNVAKDKYDEDTGRVNVKTENEVTPSVHKYATSVTEEKTTWKIAVEIPKNWHGPLVVTDLLPGFSGEKLYDAVESVTVDGYTEVDSNPGNGTYTKTIERAKDWQGNECGDATMTLDFGEISASNENRTINITVVTDNNPEWIARSQIQSYLDSHTNNVEIGDIKDPDKYGSDQASVQPKPRTIVKEHIDNVGLYDYKVKQPNTFDSWDVLDTTVIIPFRVRIAGVGTDNVDIRETFNTEIFKVYQGSEYYDSHSTFTDRLKVYYNGNPYNPGTECGYATVTPTNTGAILHLTNLPKTEGNAYYGFYTVVYYLVVQQGKMDDFLSYVAQYGTDIVDGEGNVTGKTYSFTNTADWDGVTDDASFPYTIENVIAKSGHQNASGNYEYTITLNPDKLKLNGGREYTLTDVFSGITVDKNSISITSVPTKTFGIYDSAAQVLAAQLNHTLEPIAVIHDPSGAMSVTVPDQTAVTITYTGVPNGSVTTDSQTKKATTQETNTVDVLDYHYRVEYTHEHSIINKTKQENQDGSITFTIDLNPDKIALKGGSSYTLTDTLTGLAVDESTFRVTVCDPDTNNVKADAILASRTGNGSSASPYTFTIPDQTHVTIVYDARPDYELNSQTGAITATYTNTAEADNIPSEIPGTVTTKVLQKFAGGMVATGENEGKIPFTIVFNPTGMQLNNGNDIELKDTFTNLIVEYSSITIDPAVYPAGHPNAGEPISYNYSGNTGTFMVPDSTKITITYYAGPDFSKGETVNWSNRVTAKGYSEESNGTETMSSSVTSTGSSPHTLYLFKYETGHMERPLNGVTFKLFMDDGNGGMLAVTDLSGNQVQFTTQKYPGKGDGYQLMLLNKSNINEQFVDATVGGFKADTIYYLQEVAAPTGYYLNELTYNLVWHSNTKEIDDPANPGQKITVANDPYVKPSYMQGKSVYVFGEGETVKITNDKISTDVTVEKYWVNGNGSWDWPGGIDKVTVKLQQKVGSGEWKDISAANGNIPSYYWNDTTHEIQTGADGSAWTSTRDLTVSASRASWSHLDMKAGEETAAYRVVEISMTAGGVTEPVNNGVVTINGKTYRALGGEVKNNSTFLTNAEITTVEFEKLWGLNGGVLKWKVPAGVTVTDGTNTYSAGETVNISQSDLRVKVRLHRYVYQGGDKITTYDFDANDSFYEAELYNGNWTAYWSGLETATLIVDNSEIKELDYSYEVEESEVTVLPSVLKNASGDSAVELLAAFKSSTRKDQAGKLIMTNTGEADYSLAVTKHWVNANDQPTTGQDIQFQLIRHQAAAGGGSGSEAATIQLGNSYNWDSQHNCFREGNLWHTRTGYNVGDTITLTFTTMAWFNGYELSGATEENHSIIQQNQSTLQTITFTITASSVVIKTKDGGINGTTDFDFSLVSSVGGSTLVNTDEILQPDGSGGYEVDSAGNYTFTLSTNQTMLFRNLPWQNQNGSETYTYSVREITTGDFTTLYAYSPAGTAYDPAPAQGGTTGSSGAATITNKSTTQYGSLTVTKNLYLNGQPDTVHDSEAKTFYAGLFTDHAGTTLATPSSVGGENPKSITVGSGASSGTAEFTGLTIGDTYYVFETNSTGTAYAAGSAQDGYTVTYGTQAVTIAASGNEASVTNNKETLSRNALKQWANNATPPAGTSVKLEIKAMVNGADVFSSLSGVTGDKAQTLPNGTSWAASWSNLPKYYQGQGIAYTVEETEYKINGVSRTVAQPDATAASGYDFSFTNVLPITDVTVTKTWGGTDVWPDNKLSVEMTLKANDAAAENLPDYNGEAQTATVTLTSTESTKTWHDLPVYDAGGNAIVYTVEETGIKYDGNPVDLAQYTVIGGSLTNGTATIDNTPVTIGLTLNKQWLQNSAALTGSGILPNGSITVKVEQSTDNGATWSVAKDSSGQNIENVQITSADNWTKTWSGLPEYAADGTEIQYRVTETAAKVNAADDLTVDSQNKEVAFTSGAATLSNPLPTVDIPVTKAWVNGTETAWPSDVTKVTVGLYANGAAVKNPADTSADYKLDITSSTTAYTVTFTGLPRYTDQGVEIAYSVKEDSVTIAGSPETTVDVDQAASRVTVGTGENQKIWTVISAANAGGYTITNSQNATTIAINKRWYNAYGGYESGVTVPVTVELHKVKNASDTVVNNTITVTPGTATVIAVDDIDAQYYVVETPTFEGYVARYAVTPIENSKNEDQQNDADRYVGFANGSDATISAGGTLYVMNTAAKTTKQIALHKKWIEFRDANGQVSYHQLDGDNTWAERQNMKLTVQLFYEAYEAGNPTNKIAGPLPATPAFDIWVGNSTHPFGTNNTIKVENRIVTGGPQLNMIFKPSGEKSSDFLWIFSEESGNGQENDVRGLLPEYGYVGGTLVKYAYYFDEIAVLDGSADWDHPEDVTSEWWELWENKNGYESNPTGYIRTNIENRKDSKGSVKIEKEWTDGKDNGATAVLLTLWRIRNGMDAGVELTDVYDHPADYGLAAGNIYEDSTGNKYLKLSKGTAWEEILTVANLPLTDIQYNNGGESFHYYVVEAGYLDAQQEMHEIANSGTIQVAYMNLH